MTARVHDDELRDRLRSSRLLLLFTPELCGARDPLECLEAALPACDVVQVRIKALGGSAPASTPAEAAETLRWTRAVLERVRAARARCLVLVNDRVDVARLLLDEGVAGVHLGQDDCPPEIARACLGPRPLLGWSTHSQAQVLEADELPIDACGFGPVHATPTKGYARGLGAEAAWIASLAAEKPVFPIGGIDLQNAQELARIGRAAVGAAILGAPDPGRAAHALRRLLEPDADD